MPLSEEKENADSSGHLSSRDLVATEEIDARKAVGDSGRGVAIAGTVRPGNPLTRRAPRRLLRAARPCFLVVRSSSRGRGPATVPNIKRCEKLPGILLTLLVTLAVVLGPSARAQEVGAAAPEDEAFKPRAASSELGIVLVPWGVAYTRAGAGLTLAYKLPLIQQRGLLWDSTNVTFGLTDFYGFVNNTAAGFVEVTPIAFFKLRVAAGYDLFMVDPSSGGVRVLTALGRQRLLEGQVKRGQADAVDWVDGQDNRAIFDAPVPGGGLRLKVLPTLQIKFGPVGIQYNYTADFNFYSAGAYGPDDIFHDSVNFTLRKMRDFLDAHELVAVCDVPGVGGKEALAGVTAKYYRAAGTGLSSLGLNAMLFYRPDVGWFGPGVSPWAAAQLGTNLIDPMHPYDFSWVIALGLDWKLL